MKKKRYNKSTKKRSKKHKENKDPYFQKNIESNSSNFDPLTFLQSLPVLPRMKMDRYGVSKKRKFGKVSCLSVQIPITTKLFEVFILGRLHLGPGIVLDYFNVGKVLGCFSTSFLSLEPLNAKETASSLCIINFQILPKLTSTELDTSF